MRSASITLRLEVGFDSAKVDAEALAVGIADVVTSGLRLNQAVKVVRIQDVRSELSDPPAERQDHVEVPFLVPPPEGFFEEATPATHRILYSPSFQLVVALPPGQDPLALAAYAGEWDEALSAPVLHLTWGATSIGQHARILDIESSGHRVTVEEL